MDVDESLAVNVELQTGEAALFDYSIAHASHPNKSDDRRIGIVLRYIPPETRQVLADWDSAALVRGEDTYGHFEHEPVPQIDLDPVADARPLAYFTRVLVNSLFDSNISFILSVKFATCACSSINSTAFIAFINPFESSHAITNRPF